MRLFRKIHKRRSREIDFDEILLDSSNLPSFDTARMEGRIEKPISRASVLGIGVIFVGIVGVFTWQLFTLQVIEGAEHASRSAANMLDNTLIVAERGVIIDRYGELLAWNERDHTGQYGFPVRAYTDRGGLGQLIGYVSYPQKDSSGVYYRTEYLGRSGVEEAYHEQLAGTNGRQLVEMTAHGERISEHTVDEPVPGTELQLSIDADLSEAMYRQISTTTERLDFRSGAGAIMDIHTGEIIAMTSFPSYDPEVLSDGDDVAQIQSYNDDDRYPFLNKMVGGAYTPGSIVKPFVAYGALAEKIIDPMKIIVSNGRLVVPNPYDPDNPSIFKDWRAHGPMTMRDAIAYSSNVYFYTIGGGFEGQEGLGITRLAEYFKLFGLGDKTNIGVSAEARGLVPTPAWKEEVFDDDWRLGDTYLTAIGQFGFQATGIQMLRAYAALANGGDLVTPQLVSGTHGDVVHLDLDQEALAVVREGMRRTVIQDGGTARALERNDVQIAGKSGTAEVGVGNSFVNSWIAGYFPYEDPKYAFILFMEHGPRANTFGAGSLMGLVFEWIAEHRPALIGATE